jgi:Holliday junction DNA helicase RuvB
MEKIIARSADILKIDLPKEAALAIAGRARRTPRIANRLLKRVRDYCQVRNNGLISFKACDEAFSLLAIDDLGLDAVDRKILTILIDKFQGGPVGLNTLAAATGEEIDTLENIYEPYLLQLGFLDRSSRGRVATAAAYSHLGRNINSKASLL